MSFRIKLFSTSTLARRLSFWFALLVLVPMLAATLLIDHLLSDSIREKTIQKLTLISRDKASTLESYANERTRAASAIGRIKRLSDGVMQLRSGKLKAEEIQEVRATIDRLVQNFGSTLGFTEITVVCPFGNVLYASSTKLPLGSNLWTGPLKDKPIGTLSRRTQTLLEPDISDFYVYPGQKDPIGHVAAPIIRDDGTQAGILILELNTKEILSVIDDYQGLGQTGYAVLGANHGDEIKIVAGLRSRDNPTLGITIKQGAPYGQGIQKAVKGDLGGGEIIGVLKQPVFAAWTYIPSFRWGLAVQETKEEALAIVGQQRLALLGFLAAILTPTFFIALMVARSISNPIQTAVAAAERVASGDLRADLSAEGQDETAKLINALGQMVNYLNGLIGQVQRSTIDLVSTANSLGAMTRTQSEEVNNLGSTTTEIAAATREISQTAEELLRTMTGVTQTADETTHLANEGQDALGVMESSMRTLSDATHSISARLGQITERANTISSVTTTITKIADQTNLLSLNASIEAEKAGEYGLGFAVLAREIRRLADQTAVATLDIEHMVKEMQDSVSSGVMEMDKFSDQVNRSVAETHEIGESFSEIIQKVQALLPQFDQVHEGMRSQSAGARQISDSMVSLTESVRVSADSLEETRGATHRLESAIDELRNEISLFKLRDSLDSKGSS